MNGRTGWLRRGWPVIVGIAGVVALIATQPELGVCPEPVEGWGGVGGSGLCLPTPLRDVTGADPFLIALAWLVLGAAIALTAWLVARFVTRRGDL